MTVNQRHLLQAYFWFICFQEILHVAGITRVLGIFNPVPIFLGTRILIDVIFVCFYFLMKTSPKFPLLFLPFLFVSTYPILIGVFNKNINVTFFSDIFVYHIFIFKIMIFYALFQVSENRTFFLKFAKKLSIIALSISFMLVFFFQVLHFLGYSFYFSLTPEITYGYALAVTTGKLLLSYLYLISGILSGKRMLLIGMIVMFFLLYKRYLNKRSHNAFFLIIAIPASISIVYYFSSVLLGLNKIVLLFKKEDLSDLSLIELIKNLDSARYTEVVSIIKSMSGIDYILGKGYGFRYFYLDNIEMKAAGLTHSNAHFSPAGVLSKFGILGVVLWSLFLFGVFCKSFLVRLNSNIDYANFVFFFSIMIQSLFAYIIFSNPMLPIVIGYIMSSKMRKLIINDEVFKSNQRF